MTVDHTPTPWRDPGNGNIVGADNSFIGRFPRGKGPGASARQAGDTKLTIVAVNYHARLMQAIRGLMTRDTSRHPGEAEAEAYNLLAEIDAEKR